MSERLETKEADNAFQICNPTITKLKKKKMRTAVNLQHSRSKKLVGGCHTNT